VIVSLFISDLTDSLIKAGSNETVVNGSAGRLLKLRAGRSHRSTELPLYCGFSLCRSSGRSEAHRLS
jgi:hypothetical protein